jgi:hypothetical protein
MTSNIWVVDKIATGNEFYDSSRLRYTSSQTHPQLAFEMIRTGDEIKAFINLTRYRLPEHTKVIFKIEQETFQTDTVVHEGGMHLRLTKETTDRLIQALQDGHKIGILLDDFEEILDPDEFSSSFAEFIGGGHFFQNLLKGRIP